MKDFDVTKAKYDPKQEEQVKKGFFNKVKSTAGKVPFVKDAVAMYYCAIDPETPLYAKGVAFGALAYFISPLDAISDVIPMLGFTDDAGVVLAALKVLDMHIKPVHREKASEFLS
ncbi:DUF1232 domain-containing protein [Paenibacillus peoriae]|jgi:uncharacterized membrane protein YkvA (DUF1232 family)|nr:MULTISPECIES: YkvA family protein [Paenibacillus]KAF6629930.1 DUF1232 domain-containing protein [Paenibacillus sp. EKM208P]ADM71691.1 hypothetical protein PPE_03894 [Paenibacillus polymyxa E681]AOK89703.1 hypothetical protein AOU00_07670 [Paenibacillus polymyxa]APB69773.1 DUF1232 domain-containing protein [Paenibacillus polymyxa]KOS03878.1 hypothetical protein AM598_04160 [Paenibacillus polymyxa]